MNYFELVSDLLPFASKIQKGAETVGRIIADPGVKDLIATVGEIAAVLAKHQTTGTTDEKTSVGNKSGGAIG